VERRELWFRPAGEKLVFKLHLQVETWFWKVFRGGGLVTGVGMFSFGKTLMRERFS
jgi:hypothetical protein